jgi:carboxypeptidase family protein
VRRLFQGGRGPAFALIVLALLFLSGCTGKNLPANVGGSNLPSQPTAGAFDDDTGAVEGTVLDEESSPIAGVDLLLMPGSVAGQTAANGGYSFSFLPPGQYALIAVKLGYKQGEMRVDVKAGETVTNPDLVLKQIPVARPHSQVLQYTGYLECRWASFGSGLCGSTGICLSTCITTNDVAKLLWTRDKNEFLFQLQDDSWQEIVFETRWQASTVATSPKMSLLFSYKERPGNHEFGSSSNVLSPIWWNYTKGVVGENARTSAANTPKEPNANLTLRAWLAVGADLLSVPDEDPAGVTYETKYDMFVTVFYDQKAPPKYTALPPS